MTQPLQTQSLSSSPDPNVAQQRASIPDHDVWVAASAGSGKTKVLTDRVLRLLLPDPEGRWEGAAPHKILCITFTKAGAAEMALRVQKKLGEWVTLPDERLEKDLSSLLGVKPSATVLSSARLLFSKVLDVPSGLSIMTIHAFCQSTLGRFSIEAGVTPGFIVLEESRAKDCLSMIIRDVIRDIQTGELEGIGESFSRLATYVDLEKLQDILLKAIGKSREIKAFLEQRKTNSTKNDLLIALGYEDGKKFLIPDEDLLFFSRAFADKGGKAEKEGAQDIVTWLSLPEIDRLQNLFLLQNAFCTKEEKKPRRITKAVLESYPDCEIRRTWILEVLNSFIDNQKKYICTEQTADLLAMVEICLDRYAVRKQEMNALDFNDLILKTRTLLESQSMDWVHYKLDEGIDHILVDEAQDTNIHQWKIIEYLTEEMQSGLGNDKRQRSFFVVGDEKQSIFSFHGADPDAFQTMRGFFEKRSKDAGRVFDPVRLETSFRTTLPVLQLVDTVFGNSEKLARLGLSPDDTLVHYSHRKDSAGLVECWPLVKKERRNNRNTPIEWILPPLSNDAGTGQSSDAPKFSALAPQIAMKIADWLQKGEILESEARRIEPRDILVLVRTRTGFVPDLVRQLKLRGIPVSGADRMKLGDQIAVMDCMALAQFARFPDDDLSLACLLRSPFLRLSENSLMDIALHREGSLWESAQRKLPSPMREWLESAVLFAKTAKPFDFFDHILNTPCPYGDGQSSGWKAFSTCLGMDCLDPLDEFLTYCLLSEDDGVFSLEEFCHRFQKSDIIIKREQEEGDKESNNQVRIMTVHASKGLEAPIVILPDTTGVPSRSKIDALQWMEDTKIPAPLWVAQKDDACQTYLAIKENSYDKALSEHMRLLYVALTRPRDRLYIMGETAHENLNENSWYAIVENALRSLPTVKEDDEQILRLTSPQTKAIEQKEKQRKTQANTVALPDWVLRPVQGKTTETAHIIQPSRLSSGEGDLVRSPLGDNEAYRFLRGNLTHKLFQILPELPRQNRAQAAKRFLDRMGFALPDDVKDTILDEVLRILNDPTFADVFSPQAMAEVPIAGDMGDGRLISGQIDRLIIDINRILIVDFKTNRPSPRTENDIPENYRNQLKAYKTALMRIFPDRPIRCALLWTDQPLLMPVSV